MKRMEILFRRGLLAAAAVSTLLLLLLNLFFHSTVDYTVWETVRITPHGMFGLAAVLGSMACVCILARLKGLMQRINPHILFAGLTVLYAAAAAYLICNQNNMLRADASFVYNAALEIKKGVFTSLLPENYIGTYPHQTGLLLYDWLLLHIAQSPVVNFIINWMMIIGINFTCWKISRELFRDRLTENVTILFCFGFFPQLFFILFAYGQIPGLFFMLCGFQQVLRFGRTNRWKHLIGMTVCLSLAVIIRSNCMIGIIACILYLLLCFLRDGKFKRLASILVAAVCLFLPATLVRTGVETAGGTRLNKGIPYVLWVSMGTDIDNRTSGPGWFDTSPNRTYRDAGFDAETAGKAGWEKLQDNLDKIRQNPRKAALFFRDKLISTWCDPLYESIWSGPMQVYSQTTYTPLLMSVYGGGKAEDMLESVATVIQMLIWIGSAAFLLCCAKRTHGWEVFFLYLIGGVLFHLFWETKSQYVYPYVLCLLPFAAYGISQMSQWMHGRFTIKKDR